MYCEQLAGEFLRQKASVNTNCVADERYTWTRLAAILRETHKAQGTPTKAHDNTYFHSIFLFFVFGEAIHSNLLALLSMVAYRPHLAWKAPDVKEGTWVDCFA